MPLSILVLIVFRVESSPGGEAVDWRTWHHNRHTLLNASIN